MTASTRVRLGSYFLFALLLLTVPVALVVTHLNSERHAMQLASSSDGVRVKNIGASEQAIRFFQKRDGLSREAALRVAEKQMRANGDRLLDDTTIAYGTQLDYYKVDGSKVPNTAKFEGSARVLDPKSPEGRAFVADTRYHADTLKKDPSMWATVQSELKKGYVLAPLSWFEGPIAQAVMGASAAKGAAAGTYVADQKVRKGTLPRAKGAAATQQQKICVIATEFPGFTDLRPRSNGDLDPNNDGGTVYRYSTLNGIQNYPGRSEPTAGGMDNDNADQDSILDSPGGVFSSANMTFWGVPNGIPNENWDAVDELPARSRSRYMSDNALGTGMDALIYDQGQTSFSLSNFLWQNTRGNIRITGSYGTRDVVGWISSAHVLNRYRYREQIQPYVQPGTPLFRTEWRDAVQEAVPANTEPVVLRATCSDRGVTILFDRNLPSWSMPEVWVYQTQDCNSVAANTQATTVRIDWANSNYVVNMDPYDRRRWTIANTGTWRFVDLGDATKTIAYAPADNRDWYLVNTNWGIPGVDIIPANIDYNEATYGPARNQNALVPGTYKSNQRRGCPRLPDTVKGHRDANGPIPAFDYDVRGTTVDDWVPPTAPPTQPRNYGDKLLGRINDPAPTSQGYIYSRPFNRLCTYDYYTHAYFPNTGSQFYQISHMRNEWGYDDDISGTVIPNSWSYRNYQRPIPFDYEPNDPGNAGYWPTQFETNPGRHRSTQWEADIALILKDEGIDVLQSGKYQKFIYLYPGGTSDELGANRSDIIPHGGGSTAVMPENFSLGLAAHEVGHTLGAKDLYDNDYYTNRASPAPTPQWHESDAINPYSIMGHGGGRFDAYHLIDRQWVTETVLTQDTLGVNVPEVEGTVYDPVILKLPANPYYIKNNTDASLWKEYFLVENRNLNGAAYFNDSSPRGLYIYHIDTRDCAQYEAAGAGFQRDDLNLTVAIEQADGKYELEVGNDGTSTQAQRLTDPFGDGTAANVTRFWQFPGFNTKLNDFAHAMAGLATSGSPTSFSHGYTYEEQNGGAKVIVPNTATDSFTRLINISQPGQVMTTDVYVQPAEIIATKVAMPNTPPAKVQQGQDDVPFMVLKLENRSASPNLSMKNVYLDTLRILESGTNTIADNLTSVKLYLDANKDGVLDLGTGDTLLATTTLDTDPNYPNHAVFNNLGFLIPLDDDAGDYRQVIIAYDIAPEAQTNPRITVGAEFTDVSKIMPRVPGAVQDRIRQAGMYNFGASRFPIQTATSIIYNSPDRLVVTQQTPYPAANATPSQANVGMLRLRLETNKGGTPRSEGFTRVSELTVEAESATGFSAPSELTNVVLWDDLNRNGAVDVSTDTKLAESSFTMEDPDGAGPLPEGQLAKFINLNVQVLSGAANAKDLIVAANIAPGATVGKTFKLSVKFPTPGGWNIPTAQEECYVQVMNPTGELAANKDFVEFGAADTTWPIESGVATIINPNTPPNRPTAGFAPTSGLIIFTQSPLLDWDAASDPDPADTPDTLSYKVDLSTDGTFGNIIRTIDTTLPNVTEWQVPAPLLAPGTYYWRVRTKDSHGAYSVQWSDTQQFVVQLNNPPNRVTTGLDPRNISVTTLTPQVMWNKTTDPDPLDTPDTLSYHLQIDDNADFSSPHVDWTGAADDNIFDPANWSSYPALQWGVQYYWRVQAIDNKGAASPWTSDAPGALTAWFRTVNDQAPYSPNSFTLNTAASVPGIETLSAQPVLGWGMPNPPDPDSPSDSLANIHYQIQLSDVADLASVAPGGYVFEFTTADNEMTKALPISLTDNTHYYWRVRSVDDEGAVSPWATVQDFWVNTANNAPVPPAAGFDPVNGATVTSATPTLSWDNSPDPDVDPYDGAFTDNLTPRTFGVSWIVELSTSQTFASINYTYTLAARAAAGNPQVLVTTPLTTGIDWYWRVYSVDNDGAKSAASAAQKFIVDLGAKVPTAPVAPFTPANNSSVSSLTPRLEWGPGSDLDPADTTAVLRYEVQVAEDAAFASVPGYFWAGGPTPQGQQYIDIPGGSALALGTTYYWRVRTVDSTGLRSPWTAGLRFTVVDNRAPNAVVAPFSPLNGQQIADQTPTLSWSLAGLPDPDANDTAATLHYLVQVDDDGVNWGSPEFIGTTADGVTSITVNSTLSVGVTYYWRVAAVDNTGATGPWQVSALSFHIVANQAPYAPGAPFTLVPVNTVPGAPNVRETSSATPRISWTAAAPADPNTDDTAATMRYAFQLSATPDFSNGVYLFTKGTAAGETFADVTTTLSDNTRYYYRVLAVDPGGLQSPWSAAQSFWVNTANNAPAAPNKGFNPASGNTVTDLRPVLSWDNSVDCDADPYDANVTNGAVIGVTFVVQIGTTADLSAPTYTYTTGAGVASVTPTVDLTEGIPWFWRVKAVDDDGAGSPWSGIQTFTINTTQQPPAAPGVNTLSPAGAGAMASSLTPRLSWSAAVDPDDPPQSPDTLRYEVQVSADPNMATGPGYYWTNAGALTPAGQTYVDIPGGSPLSLGQRYYWRVRTIDPTNLTSPWTTPIQQFTIGANRVPNQVTAGFTPTAGASVTANPTLSWTAATPPDPDADDTAATMRYEVTVDTNSNFLTPKFSGTTAAGENTIAVTTPLTVGLTYYWRVRAIDQKGAVGAWSPAATMPTFTVIANQAPVTPIARFTPSGSVTVNTAVPTLSWNNPVGPNPCDPNSSDTIDTIRYQIQINDEADFSGTPIFAGSAPEGQTFFDVPLAAGLQDNAQYFWRVRALDRGNLNSPWTALQDFWVNTGNNTPLPPTAGFSPIDGAGIVDTTPLLQWAAGSDPDPGDTPATLRYQVQLSADNFATPAAYTYATAAGGVLSLTVTTPLADGRTWYWRVRTIDSSGAAADWDTLSIQSFRLDTANNAPTPPAAGFNPAGGRNVSDTTPTFTFDAGADTLDATDPALLRYEIEVSDTNAFTFPPAVGGYYYFGASAAGVTSITLPDANSLATGTYYWHVRTVDDDNARSLWSGTQIFVVGANRPPTVAVAPFVPTNNLGVSDPTPLLTWGAGGDPDANDTPDVLRYRVQVDDNANFSSMVFDLISAAGATQIECVPSTPLREGAVYYWRIYTIDVAGEMSGPTATQSFHLIQNRAPEAPIAAFSPSRAVEIGTPTPTLTWNMPAQPDLDPNDTIDVLRWQVQVSDKSDMAIGPYVFTTTTTVAVPNLLQAIVTDNLLDNTHYWWRVRTLDAGGLYSDWSTAQDFWVNLVNQAPRAPDSGFDPANGRQITDNTPTISWTGASDDDPFDSLTLHYVVELSKLADFSKVDYQYTTADGVTSAIATAALTDRTTWYWRVRSVDDDGAQSPWSVVQDFILDMNNQAPVLSNPVVNPMYGALGITYTLEVTYTDAEGDPPGKVYCQFDDGRPALEMTLVSGTARTGILYRIGVTGAYLGLGAHSHAFSCDAGARLPLTGYDLGPVIGVASSISLTDASGTTTSTYEEGQPIYVRVQDADENLNPAAAETIPVTVAEAGGDVEVITLTETGANTGIFAGSVATLGKAGVAGDGVLNAIGGTNGNRITAGYMDPDDTSNPTPDAASTTAMLFDTVAPARVGGKLVVSSGIDGRTADLSWDTYDEAAQVDVAGYHIYYSTTNFTSTAAMTPLDTVAAGTRAYQVTGLLPNTTYYFAVGPFDEVPNERRDLTPRQLRTDDSNPPAISALMPADGATEVARDTTISFDLDDPGVGIDRPTLQVVVTQNGQTIACAAPVVTGDRAHMHVVVTPSAPLEWNGVIQVSVTVSDLDANQLNFSDWAFGVVTDTEAPTIDTQVPAPNATRVPVSTTVAFHLKDAKSGIANSTIKMKLNGVDVSAALSTSGPASDVAVLYDPPTDLSYSAQYTVEVNAQDVAGNPLPTTTWTFQTVQDATGIVIDQYDPARDAVDVPVETNISLRLTDPQAGIDRSTFRLLVQNVDVTNNVTITQTPDPSDHPTTMLVTYNPPQNLPYATDIQVSVHAQDVVGNATDLTYKFTTVDAPTYNISGMITDTNGNPLPGAKITAGGLETLSDGTGAYRIVGLLDGTYTVSVSRAEYVFDVAQQEVTLAADDAADVDFVGRLLTYSLRGTVKEGQTGLAGVQVAAGGKTATTAADGTYSIDDLPNGQYTVTPTLLNYHFQPVTRSAQVASADVTGVDFAAIADTFTVQGTVKDSLGNVMQGVQVTCGEAVAVTNAAGEYTVTGLRAGTYTLSASKAGYTINPGTVEVTVPPSKTGVNFTALISMSNTFPSGWNMIGVPGTPADQNANNAFGTTACYRWDPESIPATYRAPVNDPTLEVVRVRPGRGYFVKYDRQTTVQVAGEPTDPTRTVSIGLSEGWNMIANTQSMPTKWSRFVPSQVDGIRPFAFVYDGTTGSYKMVSNVPSLNAERDSLLGWEGAWVRASSGGVSLLVTGGSGTAEAVVRPQQADLNGGWVIPVVAKAGNRADLSSIAGLVPGSGEQHVIENPPTAPNTVDVYFTNTAGQRLAHDVRSQAGAQTYTFVVACAVPDSNVTVSLPDLSQVPASMQIMLVDKATGKSLYARTLQSYKYHSAGESSEREFELIIAPRTAGSLAVTATSAAAKGDGMVMTYSVTKACSVNIRVLNLAGRPVKVLAANKVVAAGMQTQLWNLMSDAGTKVPVGTYLLQIDAVTENGQSVRGLTQVRVGR